MQILACLLLPVRGNSTTRRMPRDFPAGEAEALCRDGQRLLDAGIYEPLTF